MPYVIVRTFSAGVHCGELRGLSGTEAILANARRVWYWMGAFTLHELSLNGPAKGSKISAAIPLITLTQAIEVIPCAEKAVMALREFPSFEP